MIYLDNSATTKPFDDVIDSYIKVATNYFGNPSSLHGIGGQAEKLLSHSRTQIASLLHVKPQEIIFTSGGSEGNNFAVKGIALQYQNRGKHIITTSIEHPSVSEACKQLTDLGFEITYLPVDENGVISIKNLKNAIREDTILVSIIHVNNEVGTIQPIEEIGNLLEKYPKIIYHVDHVQGIGKTHLDFNKTKLDLCTISGHKFNGLKGTGVLFVRQGIRMKSLIAGGDQELQKRAGTENIAGFVALAKALRLTIENRDVHISHLTNLKRTIAEKLSQLNGVKIHTPMESSAPHIINFSIEGLKPEVFVHLLEEKEIYVSTTSACSSKKNEPSKTLLAMGVPKVQADSSIRISLSHQNQVEEVPILINAIENSLQKLQNDMGDKDGI
ncbi:cysteine desulfurase family protein [Bacillus sp. REN16]|uniref:cysteine desulfurase family protein n=1 Tax=Bacillus sp. REN16 TaxID=2887296 RepID=UPI001E2A32B6|nr:cysteine desulfurase family protein [Bacillus sp. REN16]MCC3356415.1 cysteine desulfurase [Bacillus sp. REN16]